MSLLEENPVQSWDEIAARLLAGPVASDLVSQLVNLPAKPGVDGYAARQKVILNVFFRLVNIREYQLGNELAAKFRLRDLVKTARAANQKLEAPDDIRTMFCLAVLDTKQGGDAERARNDFISLRNMLPEGHHLIQACNDGEGVATRLAALRREPAQKPRGLLARLGLARDTGPRRISFADFTIQPAQSRLPWLDREDVDETRLTASQKAWRRDGVLMLPNFLPERDVDAYVARRAQLKNPAGWLSPTPYQHVPELRALALYPPLMAMQKHLLGDDMLLHLALTGWISTERDWHQDDYLNPAFVMTRYTAIWMALADISPDSGPFEYVPGSHRWPLISGDKVRKLLNSDEQGLNNWESRAERFMTPAIEAEIAARGVKPVQFIANKGDVLIWHARLMHRGTAPRRPSLDRRSLITHYSSTNHRPDMPNRANEKGGEYALFDRELY